MDLRKTILAEHSKAQTLRIVAWIGADQQRFDQLFRLFMMDEYKIAQRAAWPLSCAVENHPGLIKKHFGALIKNLSKPGSHEAVKRHTVRILEFVDIPKRWHGAVMNLCFNWITDPAEKPAVKASSLTALGNLSKLYPEIKNELKLTIQSQGEQESPAFRSRARKVLKQL